MALRILHIVFTLALFTIVLAREHHEQALKLDGVVHTMRSDSDRIVDQDVSARVEGCSAACTLEPGFACNDGVTTGGISVCSPVCGDGVVVNGEMCDDGNRDALDGCSGICTVEPGWLCTHEVGTAGPDSCRCAPWQYGGQCENYCHEKQSCQDKGFCDSWHGTCVCDTGYFDDGCSTFRNALYQRARQVSPLGSNLTIDYFGAEGIYIPPAALSVTTRVSITLFDPSVLPTGSSTLRHVGTIKDFAPHGQNFALPVTMWLRFNATALDNQNSNEWDTTLGLYYYNETLNEWTLESGFTIDKLGTGITHAARHFSKYAVMETVTPVVEEVPGERLHSLIIMAIAVGSVLVLVIVGTTVYVLRKRKLHARARQLRTIRSRVEHEGVLAPGSSMKTMSHLASFKEPALAFVTRVPDNGEDGEDDVSLSVGSHLGRQEYDYDPFVIDRTRTRDHGGNRGTYHEDGYDNDDDDDYYDEGSYYDEHDDYDERDDQRRDHVPRTTSKNRYQTPLAAAC